MKALLENAVVRRVDLSEAVAAVEVRSPGESAVILLGITRGMRGVGVITSDERRASWGGRLPAGFTRTRSDAVAMVEGGHVVAVSARSLTVEKMGERRVVEILGSRVVVRTGEGFGSPAEESERAEFEARGKELLANLSAEARERRREQVMRAIGRGVAKLERRIVAMNGDLARLGDAEALASQAQWLVAEAARAPRGARSLKVTDWTSGEARVVEVPLDPSKPARVQVEAMFQRARRLKRGALISEERIAKARTILEGLERTRDAATSAGSVEEIDAALDAARALAPKDVAALESSGAASTHAAEKAARSMPFRRFVTPGGMRIFVGKGAAQNDRLTFQTARPHDLWLHVRGQPGAHVIVPLAKNTSCPGDLLVDAAHLAAHFSDARGEALVEVDYAPRRYVRKPRGSAPGLVVVEREKVLTVRLEPGRIERLLAAEE
jgi:predicted ribosome quality control (RQC) complex YloA/Tae2 family protein